MSGEINAERSFCMNWLKLLGTMAALVVIDCIVEVICAMSDRTFPGDMDFRDVCKEIAFIVMMAVLENATRLGLPVPRRLKEALVKLHDENGKGDEPK